MNKNFYGIGRSTSLLRLIIFNSAYVYGRMGSFNKNLSQLCINNLFFRML